MVIRKNELLENIKYNLISIIILMNPLQLILFWDFNIRINMWIEYGLILIILILVKFKIKSIKNLIVLFVSLFLFFINIILNNSTTLNEYLKEFLLKGVPLIIIFSFDIDMKKFAKIFYFYNILNAVLYLFLLVINGNNRIEDYMTFGYYTIFSISYIVVYAYYHRNIKTVIIALTTIPFILINGNRGIILVIAMLIFLLVFTNKKITLTKKILFFILSVIVLLNINSIAQNLLGLIANNFNVKDSYSIRNLYAMTESNGFEEMFGGRYGIYLQAIKEIKNHPIFGLGIAGFNAKYGYFPHNILLDIYASFGVILGTIYLFLLILLTCKFYKVSKANIEVRIFFIFILANMMKLILSKTFIHDSVIWLYISMGCLIITKYYYKRDIIKKEEINESKTNNNIYSNI